MAKIFSVAPVANRDLELEFLSTVYNSNTERMKTLLARVNGQCFTDRDTTDCYKALCELVKQRELVPDYRLENAYYSLELTYQRGFINNLPSGEHTDEEADNLIDELQRYRTIRLTQEKFISMAAKPNPIAIKANAQKILESIDQNNHADMDNALDVITDRIREHVENRGRTDLRLSTGFAGLDAKLNGGLTKGAMHIIAARPSVGKTTLAMNIAFNIGTREKLTYPVLVFSAEMSNSDLADDFISRYARVPIGLLDDEKASDLLVSHSVQRAIYQLQQNGDKLQFRDRIGTAEEVINYSRKAYKQYQGIAAIIVDYVQLLSFSAKTHAENRVNELSDISTAFTRLAQELNCPFILISQLNRNIEVGGDRKPRNSDLKGSGSLEQDASVIIFIERNLSSQSDKATLHITKNRRGTLGEIPMIFKGEYKSFFDNGDL